MRVALAPSYDIGLRAGRVLLADERVEALGTLGTGVRSPDARVTKIDDLFGWDVLVSDAAIDDPRILAAIDQHVPIITPHPLREIRKASRMAPVVAAASIGSGLPAALAVLLMERFDVVESVVAAITVPAKRTRQDRSVMFPDPVGVRWCEMVPTPVSSPAGLIFAHAPYDGELTAISVRAEGFVGTHHESALDAVVDDPLFCGAIALAGAAIMLIDGPVVDRQIEVQTRATDYLKACVAAGLGVASFSAA